MEKVEFEDFEDDGAPVLTMPVGKVTRGHKSRSHDDKDKRANERKIQRANYRKQHRDLYVKETSDPQEDKRKHDEKLLAELSDIIGEYSQQRMRALHMSFRQYGNDENRMTSKEMVQSLQENNISIPSVLLKALIGKFEVAKGIDLEALFRFLKESHVRTGRDSVLAMHKRNDLSQRYILSLEEIDEDLLWRIETQLIKSHAFIDLDELRSEFQRRDSSKSGRIDAHKMKHVCDDLQLPVFGSLLKNLIKRCDEDKNDKICWPQFLSFLERAQENARVSCPSLKSLPEQMKSRIPVTPTPLDELSSKTRLSIVNKLRKKSAIKKPENNANNNSIQGNNEQSKNTPNNSVPSNQAPQNNIPDDVTTNNGHDVNSLRVEVNVKPYPETTPHTTEADVVKETVLPVPELKTDDRGQSTTKEKNDVIEAETDDDTESKHVIKIDVNIEKTPSNNTTHSTPKKETPTIKQEAGTAEVSKLIVPNVEDNFKHKYTDGDEELEEEEERVTFKNGEIISKETGIDLKPTQTTQTEDGNTVVNFEIEGKTLTFEAKPDYINQQNIDPPTQRMRLQWVYGYRGNDCRKNIHILANGEILYFMSYIAIMYNRDTHKQRHYREHTDEIKCIDVHSNKTIIATGQYASRKDEKIKAQVRVWRSDNLHTLHVFGNNDLFDKSIACVAFAPDKDILAVVDNCTEKKLTVWDTNTGEMRGQELLHTDLLCDMGFNTKYTDTLVTVGKEHTSWWKVYPDSETIQSSSKPEYDNFLRAKFVICLTFTDRGDLITGDSNGTIYVFGDGGNRITNFIKHAHDGPVFTVMFYQGQILSGGRDGIIHAWQWGRNMNSSGFLQLPKSEGGARMLRVHRNNLLVGTTMNSMLACKMASTDGDPPLQGAILEQQPICQCHYDDLRGLTIAAESRADVITAGLDGIICGFNSSARTAVNKVQFKGNQYICVDSNSEGTQLVLGTKDGHLQILCHVKEEWSEVMNRKICKGRVDCIRLSPDGRSVAMGSHDGFVYIVSHIPREDGTLVWEYIGKLQGHTGAINGMDWSTGKVDDGYMLRTSTLNMELKHWLPRTLELFSKKDIISQGTWATRSVLVDLSISGILSANQDKGVEITSLDANSVVGVAVNGDVTGKLRLFKYPCSLRGSFCHAYRSHAYVHVVKFTACGKYVMTVGGRDSCLMQWMIV